jgi:thiazole synthase ThiGH ThiG subunit
VNPREAFHAGADDLVIGLPITQAVDPLGALRAIESSLTGGREAPDPSPTSDPSVCRASRRLADASVQSDS